MLSRASKFPVHLKLRDSSRRPDPRRAILQNRDQDHSFVRFTDREDIFEALCKTESYTPDHEPLYALTAERLANKAYDSSAFVFILIELIYEFEISYQMFSRLLSEFVMALTDDIYLAASALDAYQEVRTTLEFASDSQASSSSQERDPSAAQSPEPYPGESSGPEVEATTQVVQTRSSVPTSEKKRDAPAKAPNSAGDLEQERLMVNLQLAQKKISDLGLSTRMALEMALARPDRDSVRQTLTKVHALRTAVRHFEELLSQSEDRILETIGILERPRS